MSGICQETKVFSGHQNVLPVLFDKLFVMKHENTEKTLILPKLTFL